MSYSGDCYLGFDLSTQQLKAIVIDSKLKLHHEAKVSFDDDFQEKYGIEKGVLTNPSEGEIYAPVALWLDAMDLVLKRLQEDKCDFSKIKGVSGAGMQHGTVFWSKDAESLLKNLDASKTLNEQLEPSHKVHERHGAFSHPDSPNWQDASTQSQCDAFDVELGSPEELANITGSKAHHRFSGPQIKRWHQKYPKEWKHTSRISLVSSFLSSILLGKIAPIDISDVCGMNLWHIAKGQWNDQLIKLTAGDEGVADLETKLGPVPEDGGGSFGNISSYYVKRYGFASDAQVIPCTGDNPATILALPLQPSDAMVSLGTSTTFLMSTPTWRPDPAYHFMNHPTTAGLYMFMLCYKNGGLAREQVRDAINGEKKTKSWDKFNSSALNTRALSQSDPSQPMKMGLFFPRPEIVPNVKAGQWRYEYSTDSNKLTRLETTPEDSDARTIIESQFLSLRLRAAALVAGHDHPDGTTLPPQPRRVYLVGGGSANPAIAQLAGEVLGGVEGVFKLDIGGNACALGAAYKACWGCERAPGEHFEDLIKKRWDETKFVKKVADGYKKGVFEAYGQAVRGFDMMEKEVEKMAEEHVGVEAKSKGGVVHSTDQGHGAAN